MKNLFLFFIVILLISCDSAKENLSIEDAKIKNEVLVLGTIHGKHLTEEAFSVAVLKDLILKIDPDYILVEIPPDRFPIAMNQFLKSDSITEPRVSRFPEYVDVIFPLMDEMNFKIIPTAGWTKEMSDNRNKALKSIQNDSSRTDDWSQLILAGNLSDSLIKASKKEFDPYFINSEKYDQLAEIELSVYNQLFNEELGLGGWDNINEAHYSYISKALDEYKFQGKRILITYGAGHKGWFLKKLKKRNDITVISLKDAIIPQIHLK